MSTASSGEVRRGHLLTEQANPLSTALDTLSSVELVQLFCEEDRRPQEAVAGAAACGAASRSRILSDAGLASASPRR